MFWKICKTLSGLSTRKCYPMHNARAAKAFCNLSRQPSRATIPCDKVCYATWLVRKVAKCQAILSLHALLAGVAWVLCGKIAISATTGQMLRHLQHGRKTRWLCCYADPALHALLAQPLEVTKAIFCGCHTKHLKFADSNVYTFTCFAWPVLQLNCFCEWDLST